MQVERQRRVDADGPRHGMRVLLGRVLPIPPRCDRGSAAPAGPRASGRPGCRPPRGSRTRCPARAATTTVLPLRSPRSDRSGANSRWSLTSCIRSRAASIVSSKLASGAKSASASQTIRLATSPSLWPPSPSATTQRPDLRPFDERVLVDLAHPADVAGRGRSKAERRLVVRHERPAACAPVSTRAGTGRHRCCAHEPSSSAANVSGLRQAPGDQATRLDDRGALGPPDHQRVVHGTTAGATAAVRTPARAASAEPIGICQHACGSPFRTSAAARSSTTRGGLLTKAELVGELESRARRSSRNRRTPPRASRSPGARRRRRTMRPR